MTGLSYGSLQCPSWVARTQTEALSPTNQAYIWSYRTATMMSLHHNHQVHCHHLMKPTTAISGRPVSLSAVQRMRMTVSSMFGTSQSAPNQAQPSLKIIPTVGVWFRLSGCPHHDGMMMQQQLPQLADHLWSRNERRNRFLLRFQQLRSYRDEMETRNWEEFPLPLNSSYGCYSFRNTINRA